MTTATNEHPRVLTDLRKVFPLALFALGAVSIGARVGVNAHAGNWVLLFFILGSIASLFLIPVFVFGQIGLVGRDLMRGRPIADAVWQTVALAIGILGWWFARTIGIP